MTNPSANAKFIVELAEKGKSLTPHIPKRKQDCVALWRKICWYIGHGEPVFNYKDLGQPPAWRFPVLIKPEVDALVKLRLLLSFLPIVSNEDCVYLRLLLK